jgi:lipopolysaccharide/colanic/teichoic acid biosynthesis glycosyltransferase
MAACASHYDRLKRAIDVVGAATGLVLFSPVILLAAATIALRMGRPVLFRHERPGYLGRPFTLLKFRTMYAGRSTDGTTDAQRITPLGAVLRSTSIDELPQLWNVLRGDMSLVGPRPLRMEYLALYNEEQARRHEVRPGITGWAQVNGRNAISWPDKFRQDVWYVDHRSLALDAKILLLTVRKVLLREGVSQEGQATVIDFQGNHV